MNTEARRSGVCACLLDGMSDRAIALVMGIEHRTARDDVRALRKRFEAESKGDLARLLRALLLAEAA